MNLELNWNHILTLLFALSSVIWLLIKYFFNSLEKKIDKSQAEIVINRDKIYKRVEALENDVNILKATHSKDFEALQEAIAKIFNSLNSIEHNQGLLLDETFKQKGLSPDDREFVKKIKK